VIKRLLSRRAVFAATFAATLLVGVPVAWAVGWTNVGGANIHLNSQPSKDVVTTNPVYSSEMRLDVATHPDCGGQNFWMEYLYPDLSLYMISSFREICTASETPRDWSVGGGNKYAACGELNNEPDDPTSTCQRYSTT
jgi:hypothetical protein